MMPKYLIALLVLTPCLAFAGENEDADDDSPTHTLDYSIDSAKAIQASVERQQKEWGGPLQKVGPRCIPNWSQYGDQYPALVEELKGVSQELAGAAGKLERELVFLGGSAVPESPTLASACGDSGDALETTVVKNLAALDKGAKAISEINKKASALQERGGGVYRQAGEKYARAWNCLRKKYYTDVVDIAFYSADLPGDNGSAESGFARLERASDEFAYRLQQESAALVKFNGEFEALRKRCARVQDEEKSGGK